MELSNKGGMIFDNSIQSAIFEMESRNHSPLKSLEVDFRPSFRILWKSLNWNLWRPITSPRVLWITGNLFSFLLGAKRNPVHCITQMRTDTLSNF